ncbi:hypothetical protein FQV26_01075 [Planococcus sp. CPCC 101016]|uniref:hypothetical protein n=1 Tax=Planococcus sp. CPCC 101016 TaxID=2599617 RepID=UPI0011B42231|nr:hypothetical protein [Planococcus sp. CPCC 101016]TWT06438.1 hypothetical protein FQV26_01075 [Planococcus sp. CPCC 101016]
MIQIFWYVYAAFLATSTIGFFIHGAYRSPVFLIDLAFSVIAWVGLFGFVTHHQIFTPFVWQVILAAVVLWDLLFFFFIKAYFTAEEPEADTASMTIISGVFMVVLLGPLYYALFHYAF